MRFGACELDVRSRRLRRPGRQTVLQEQPFRILLRLLERPGGVVTREEIRQELWADDTFVDFEHSINAAIKRLRDALGDSTEAPRYVETVPRQGYRLVAGLVGAASSPTAPERPHRPLRSWPTYSALAVLLVVAAATVSSMRRRVEPPAASTQRLAVAVFENRTGDAGLDALGLMAADWIAQGLLQDLGMDVVPGLVVLSLEMGNRREGPTAYDRVQRLGSQVGASVIVSGEYYQLGDQVSFQARLTDLSERRSLPRLEPVSGRRTAPVEVVTRLREQVLGAVGLSVKGAGRALEGIPSRMLGKPPVYEAYREYAAAVHYGGIDTAEVVRHLERALELDPDFTVPAPTLFARYFDTGEYEKAERLLKQTRDKVAPGFEPLRDHMIARLAGRLLEAHELALQVLRVLPRNPSIVALAARSALRVGRPADARRILDSLDPATRGSGWLTLSAQTDHLMGRYEGELEAGRAGETARPAAPEPREAQARALAATGRLDQLAVAVASYGALPPRADATPAHLMVASARELRAHGRDEASRAMARHALEWLDQASARLSAREPSRLLSVEALVLLDRWDESQRLTAAMAAEHPDSVPLLGTLGVVAARRGRAAEARGISDRLARLDRPHLLGENTYWRACIAASLGDRDLALTLLQQAFAEGKPLAWTAHAEPALESLRADPRYARVVGAEEPVALGARP